MEDHSLHGYLERQSTEELESLLLYCLQKLNYVNYKHTILEVLGVLKDRVKPEIFIELTHQVQEILSQQEPSL